MRPVARANRISRSVAITDGSFLNHAASSRAWMAFNMAAHLLHSACGTAGPVAVLRPAIATNTETFFTSWSQPRLSHSPSRNTQRKSPPPAVAAISSSCGRSSGSASSPSRQTPGRLTTATCANLLGRNSNVSVRFSNQVWEKIQYVIIYSMAAAVAQVRALVCRMPAMAIRQRSRPIRPKASGFQVA